MAAFTFIANYKGGTYIRQVSADNLLSACHAWVGGVVHNQDIPELDTSKFLKAFQEDLEDLPPMPVQNTPNVWAFAVGLGKSFMLIHLVKTAENEEHGRFDNFQKVVKSLDT